VHKADNLPSSCAVVTKSGNLNFLEPSWSLQACKGAALPLPLPDDTARESSEKLVQVTLLLEYMTSRPSQSWLGGLQKLFWNS